jgi:hypothetical protein
VFNLAPYQKQEENPEPVTTPSTKLMPKVSSQKRVAWW